MLFKGWNYEKTLLVRGGTERREDEIIDVRIPVDARSAGNLDRDVRVALKSDWNLIESEIPSQVYQVQRHGDIATCRVAFNMDVPAGETRRVGIFYDNPDAAAPDYHSSLRMEGEGAGGKATTTRYVVAFREPTGQVESLNFRMRLPNRDAKIAPLLGTPQNHAAVLFAVRDESGAIAAAWGTPAQWAAPEIVEDIRGPVFAKRSVKGRLAWPGCREPESCPELEVTYRFFARQPYFLVGTRLVFPEDTRVFGVRVGGLTVEPGVFTHYTFRPVSPSLPDTEVEEMGHILIDPAHTADLPEGPALSSLIPYKIAWHGFIRAGKGMARGIAQIQLRHAVSPEFPQYRAAAHLFREPSAFSCARAPVHVARLAAENAVTVPAGASIENLETVVCDRFDAEWGERTDRVGSRLNNPVHIDMHPRFMLGGVPPEQPEPLPRGERGDAYRRHGVR